MATIEPMGAGDEIAWRRELRGLRVRVAQLEAERSAALNPAVRITSGEHGPQCGIPCPVLVDERAPEVTCESCGVRLDPIDVLRSFAHSERNFCFQLEHLRKERADLAKEIAKLKAMRLRLRSDVRKAMPQREFPEGTAKFTRDLVSNHELDLALAREPERP